MVIIALSDPDFRDFLLNSGFFWKTSRNIPIFGITKDYVSKHYIMLYSTIIRYLTEAIHARGYFPKLQQQPAIKTIVLQLTVLQQWQQACVNTWMGDRLVIHSAVDIYRFHLKCFLCTLPLRTLRPLGP